MQQPTRPQPPDDGQTRPRAGTPWLLALLLLAGFIGLLAGLFLLWTDPGQLPAFLAPARPAATAPPAPTSTPRPVPATAPPVTTASAPLPPGLRFTLDLATIEYVPRAGRCDWLGVAGRVERSAGEGVPGLRVHLRHADSGQEHSVLTDSGGNFELRLGDVPVLSPWLVQLRSLDGVTRSDFTQIVTSEHCDQNLAVLIFREQR